MKINDIIIGGRRHFHIIIFMLLLLPTPITMASTNSPLTTPVTTNSNEQSSETIRLYHLITEVSDITDPIERYNLAVAVHKNGRDYEIDPVLLLAIARVESRFTKDIAGPGNCWGYWQINLNVHNVSKTFISDTNEQCQKACEIYNYFTSNNQNNVVKTLNGYNGYSGESNKYGKKVWKYYCEYNYKFKEYK